MNLSSLVFEVNTSALEKARETVAALAQDFSKLDKSSQQAAKTAAQTERLLAQAAKESAQARKANAEATSKELKTALAAEKADESREKTVRKTTKAVDDQTSSISRLDSLMRKTVETTAGMTEGLSKAQAAKIADAKALGATNEQLQILISNLQTQRKLQGKEPFDNSASGALLLKNALTELNAANRLYNSGLEITSKQAKDLARDQLRLIESAKARGDSIFSVREQLRKEQDDYVKLAAQYNRAFEAEQKIIKSRTDLVKATQYVASEDQKMAAALNQSNAAIDKAGSDKLVKYEAALRKSGLAQDVVTKKLSIYHAQLIQVQAAEEKRAASNLSRALAPQISDVAVSLYSGQAPLTVLLQQGFQVLDLFTLSGIEAKNFGKAMKEAFSNMIPAMMTVVRGVGGLLVDAFASAGAAAVGFVGKMTGINSVVSHTTDLLYLMGGGWTTVAKAMELVGRSATMLAGTAIFAIVAALGAMAIGLKQVISENNDLAKAFALSGGSIAASHVELTGFVKTLAASGATTGQATDALLAMAKAGTFTKDEILLVGKASIEMQKSFGIAIDDTVKQFAKLKEKPVEALLEIAKSSGMVAPEILKMVNELEKAGKVSEAAALAMKTYANVTTEQISQMKENYNGFALFIIKLGQGIKQFFSDTFKTLFVATDPNTQLANNLQAMQKRIDQLKGSIAYKAGSQASQDEVKRLEEQARMISSQISSSVRLAAEEEKRRLGHVEDAKIFEAGLKLQKEAEDAIDKATRKTLSLEEYRKEFVSKKLEDAAKEKNIDIDKLRTNTDLVKLLEKQADIQYKKDHTKDAKQAIKDLETEIDLRNKDLGLLSSFNNELDAIERRRKATGNEDKYQASLRALIEKQPVYIKQQKEINDAHDLENKLLGKSDMLGKDYYKTLELIQQRQDSGLYSTEKAEQLRKAAFDQTELAKTRLKIEESSAKLVEKYRDEIEKASIASSVENAKLDDRVALLGLTADEQKKMKIQQEQKNKLLAVELKLQTQIQEVWEKWGNGDFGVNGATKAQAVILELERQAGEERKNINREVAIDYAEDLDKEFRAIKEGISDSIVTALFEGGKAGSSKLRNVIIDALKKPVTLVVNALVNTLMGSVLGGIVGGGTEAAGSSIGTGIATSIGTSAVGSAFSLGISNFGTGMGATLGNGLFSGFGVNMSNIGGLFGAGNFSGALGAAAPYLLPIIGLIGLLSGLDDSGTYHTGGAARYSASGGMTSGQSGEAFNFGFGRVEKGDATISAMETLSKSLVEIFDGIAKTFGKTAGYEVATAFADDTSKDGAWGAFKVTLQGQDILNWDEFRQSKWAPKEFGDGEEGYKQYLAAVAKDTRQILVDMDLPTWAEDILNEIGESPSMESLTAAVQQLAVIKSTYDTLTRNVVNFTNITDESFGKLLKQFGDISTMTSQMTTYYEQYYTDFEKYNKLQKDVAKGFSDIGVAMPSSKDEFRKLAEAQDLNTEAGRKMYVQLMNLAAGFDELADVEAELASMREDYIQQILDQEATLLEQQGRNEEALRKRRELLDRQRALENARLMAINPELAKLAYQLWLLEDAASALELKTQKVEDSYTALSNSISAQTDVLNTQKQAQETIVSNLKNIFDFLGQYIRELYGEVSSTSQMLGTEGRAVISNAISTGVLPDATTLQNAITAVRTDMSNTQYTTQFEQDKARLQLAADLQILQNQTKSELTIAEKTLKAIEDQIEYLNNLLKEARKQADTALGIQSAILDVATAIQSFNDAVTAFINDGKTPGTGSSTTTGGSGTSGGAVFGGGGSGGSSNPVNSKYSQVTSLGSAGVAYIPITDESYINKLDSLAGIYHSFDGTGNLTGLLEAVKAAGGTIEDLSALSGYYASDWRNAAAAVGIPAFADGGVFTNGIVDKPTKFNMGLMGEAGSEAIMPLTNIGGQLGVRAVSDNSRTQVLEEKVQNLSTELQAIALNTSKVVRLLERVTRDGESLLVTDVTPAA